MLLLTDFCSFRLYFGLAKEGSNNCHPTFRYAQCLPAPWSVPVWVPASILQVSCSMVLILCRWAGVRGLRWLAWFAILGRHFTYCYPWSVLLLPPLWQTHARVLVGYAISSLLWGCILELVSLPNARHLAAWLVSTSGLALDDGRYPPVSVYQVHCIVGVAPWAKKNAAVPAACAVNSSVTWYMLPVAWQPAQTRLFGFPSATALCTIYKKEKIQPSLASIRELLDYRILNRFLFLKGLFFADIFFNPNYRITTGLLAVPWYVNSYMAWKRCLLPLVVARKIRKETAIYSQSIGPWISDRKLLTVLNPLMPFGSRCGTQLIVSITSLLF